MKPKILERPDAAAQQALFAAEWKRAREGRMQAARICSEIIMRRALIWSAREANHRYIEHRGAL
jgi:hypothetical protein